MHCTREILMPEYCKWLSLDPSSSLGSCHFPVGDQAGWKANGSYCSLSDDSAGICQWMQILVRSVKLSAAKFHNYPKRTRPKKKNLFKQCMPWCMRVVSFCRNSFVNKWTQNNEPGMSVHANRAPDSHTGKKTTARKMCLSQWKIVRVFWRSDMQGKEFSQKAHLECFQSVKTNAYTCVCVEL